MKREGPTNTGIQGDDFMKATIV